MGSGGVHLPNDLDRGMVLLRTPVRSAPERISQDERPDNGVKCRDVRKWCGQDTDSTLCSGFWLEVSHRISTLFAAGLNRRPVTIRRYDFPGLRPALKGVCGSDERECRGMRYPWWSAEVGRRGKLIAERYGYLNHGRAGRCDNLLR